MFTREITFRNIDNKIVTEKFYFNLTTLEFTKQILKESAGVDPENTEESIKIYGDRLNAIGESNNPLLIIETFEDMVMASIGKRTEDGLFLKTKEYAEAFKVSEAFSNLVRELTTDANAAAKFTNALLPQELLEAATDVRSQSAAQMQGYQQKQEAPKVEVVDLPQAEVVNDEMAAFKAWQEQQKAANPA